MAYIYTAIRATTINARYVARGAKVTSEKKLTNRNLQLASETKANKKAEPVKSDNKADTQTV